MGRLPNLVKHGSKLVLEIMPSVAATVIGGYLLAQIHFARAPEPQPPQPEQPVAAQSEDTPTARQERAAMREVLKERRENPETPAQVRPIAMAGPPSQPATPPASQPVSAPISVPSAAAAPSAMPASMDSIAPNEPVAPSRATIANAAARRDVEMPRPRPDAAAAVGSAYVPAPPPGLPPATASAVDAPRQLAPLEVTASVPPPQLPQQLPPSAPPAPPRGPVGVVFSTLSGFVGSAANATGHTVNWVIDLPGKAIAAGGRVIGADNPPADSPPPPSRPFS
jgi:hypothetical protein